MPRMFAGLGAYFFCRHVLQVGFWPAALAAWCYPLTGFFVFWQAYLDLVVRRLVPLDPGGGGNDVCADRRWRRGPLLVLLTGLSAIGGQPDLAAQVLLASGIYAVVPFCPSVLAAVARRCRPIGGGGGGRVGARHPAGHAGIVPRGRIQPHRLPH